MEAIFNSKLYRASNHKERINAAMENPINSKLMVQLKNALSPEAKQEVEEAAQHKQVSPEAELDAELAQAARDQQRSLPRHHSLAHFSPVVDHSPEAELDAELDSSDGVEDTTPEGGEAAEIAEVEEVEETTDVENDVTDISDTAEDVESATAIDSVNVDSAVASLKSVLSMNDATKDLARITVRNDEMWIYYSDSVNLNKIMGEVVDIVSQTFPISAQFNRLARMDNAIVFELKL